MMAPYDCFVARRWPHLLLWVLAYICQVPGPGTYRCWLFLPSIARQSEEKLFCAGSSTMAEGLAEGEGDFGVTVYFFEGRIMSDEAFALQPYSY
jgi:hypothetical protein